MTEDQVEATRARHRRYNRSEQGRARARKYDRSERGLAREARRQGTATRMLSRIAYEATQRRGAA